MGSYQPIRRIAIVGAGPSGLATAKYLIAEKVFDTIDIYEHRDNVGGIWNLSPPDRTKKIPIPQTDPRYGNHHNKGSPVSDVRSPRSQSVQSLELESPLYDYLETNIPKELIVFSEKPLAKELPLFVKHEVLLRYLEEYAADIRHLIHLNTRVKDVRPHKTSTDLGSRWSVDVENLISGDLQSLTYDAVVVANGHYTIPFVPEVTGLASWNTAYPGAVIHSKAYRKPEDFKDEKVLIIGSSVSGQDIASQIGPYCKKLLLSSRSQPVIDPPAPAPWRVDVPGLAEFLPASEYHRAIEFVDGRVETGVDAVIFATGYFYNFPFLSGINPPLVTNGLRTEHLYQHLFYIKNPTLTFPVLNLKVIPFPLAENQAAVVARVWSGRLTLPPKDEMESWERKTLEDQGSGKDFHLLKFPKDAEYTNMLYKWALSTRESPGLENNGQGKLGTFWDERLVWMRSQFPLIKETYAKKGEDRVKYKTVEELGFDLCGVEEGRAGEAWRSTRLNESQSDLNCRL